MSLQRSKRVHGKSRSGFHVNYLQQYEHTYVHASGISVRHPICQRSTGEMLSEHRPIFFFQLQHWGRWSGLFACRGAWDILGEPGWNERGNASIDADAVSVYIARTVGPVFPKALHSLHRCGVRQQRAWLSPSVGWSVRMQTRRMEGLSVELIGIGIVLSFHVLAALCISIWSHHSDFDFLVCLSVDLSVFVSSLIDWPSLQGENSPFARQLGSTLAPWNLNRLYSLVILSLCVFTTCRYKFTCPSYFPSISALSQPWYKKYDEECHILKCN